VTSTNLRKAEDAATGVSTIIYVFVALEIIATVVLASDAPSDFGLAIIFLGIISILGLLLFYYSWQSIYEVLMHIGSPLEEEPVTRNNADTDDDDYGTLDKDFLKSQTHCLHVDGKTVKRCRRDNYRSTGYCYKHWQIDRSRPSDNSPSATTSAPATEGGKRCSYSTSKGIRCKNWFDGEGPHCDDHSEGPQDDIF